MKALAVRHGRVWLWTLGLILTFGSNGTIAQQDGPAATQPRPDTERPNILLITADDMNHDSLGVTGCKIPGITPHLDRLASEGLRFVHGHVTAAVCQPSRSVLMTGRYPYRNGAMGFEPIRPDVPTLTESLRAAGYFNGIFGKVEHLAPQEKFCWDKVVGVDELGLGRDPGLYYRYARDFFAEAKRSGKPFFLMANSHDPHRPFAGSDIDKQKISKLQAGEGAGAKPSRVYQPKEVEVPGFLSDLPAVRQELAEFYTSVHRCDETVGELLRALKEAGQEDRTLVMFLSDNGMPFPFAKTNCYPFSTRTPWIVRWPGKVKGGTVDEEHFISGIDFMPTVLEAAGVALVPGMDGRSFLELLTGGAQEGREQVYTVFHQTSGKRVYPMRAVHTGMLSYIFNAWSDGKTEFVNEARGSASFKAMDEAAKTDTKVAERVRMFSYRVPEELYDTEKDPCCLRNLIEDPDYKAVVSRLRQSMLQTMETTKDPLLEAFRKQIGK
jgi:N-sulfoglucosamine sulfohydrolase